jgi:uncharacterized protein (DUF4213/DUF364 family)
MIIKETSDLISEKYGQRLSSLRLADVRIGVFLSAVKLSDGSVGTAATFSADHPFCQKVDRDFGELTPSKIKGTLVSVILESEKDSGIIQSLKMAVLNALSSSLLTSGEYKIFRNKDPLEYMDLRADKTVTIVGAFQSYIRKISGAGCKLHVLEMNENAMNSDQRKYFVAAEDYKSVLPQSDIVIITGQTLVNGTIDGLLAVTSERSDVIVTGPSCGILPDILFKNNVSILGGSRITNKDLLFEVVEEGGTGFHLFEYCAEKITILR